MQVALSIPTSTLRLRSKQLAQSGLLDPNPWNRMGMQVWVAPEPILLTTGTPEKSHPLEPWAWPSEPLVHSCYLP